MIAGILATLLTNPFDVIRARLQYNHFYNDDNANRKYNGIHDGIQKIYKYEVKVGIKCQE